MTDLTERLRKQLELFESLPNTAIASDNLAALYLGISPRSVDRHPGLPRVQVTPGRKGRRVADIRKVAGLKV
jgi:hypothetical protein